MSGAGPQETADLLIVGAGAAGLATAIFAARAAAGLRVRCVDSARRIGAKILVSGGSRCNVTNREVGDRDFWGGAPRVVRHVLRAFPAPKAIAFFAELGVALHEEEDGKMFPDTHRSRTVLDALLAEAARVGVAIDTGRRVVALDAGDDGFTVAAEPGVRYEAQAVVLATGGRSLPKTGSDGFGYELARRLGHGYVDTTPALVPLLLSNGRPASLAGISHPAALTVRVGGRGGIRLEGPMLWTHVGASGPVVLNASRHWLRARLEARPAEMLLNLVPGDTFESLDAWLIERTAAQPRSRVATIVASRLPAAVAEAWTGDAGAGGDRVMAHLGRAERRALVHALVETPLDVIDSRGYSHAEVTAGGVPLDEIDPATMESRRCRGMYLVGEMLDVDGRLGGFNFQWAWSSAWVAAQAIARARAAHA